MPAVMPKLARKFGAFEMEFDLALLTPILSDQMNEVVVKVKTQSSVYTRLPMAVGETREKWLERIAKEDKDSIRKEGESEEDHAMRLMRPKLSTVNHAYEILNGVGALFDQDPIPEDAFKSAKWLETKIFLYNVLNQADVPGAEEWAPKSIE